MKKILAVFSLIAVITMSSPVLAAPGGPHGGPHGGPRGGHSIHAGVHHRPHAHIHRGHHRGHGGVVIRTGYPRHGYWSDYGYGYWGCHRCNYRLGWGCPHHSFYGPFGGASFSFRF